MKPTATASPPKKRGKRRTSIAGNQIGPPEGQRARLQRQTRDANEQLTLCAVRQHERTEAAEALNRRLQMEIAERKLAEEALAKSEAWQRLLFENVKDFAIFSTDKEGRALDWNTGAELLFGYSRSEMLGRDVSVLFTPEDRAAGIPQQEMRAAERRGFAEDERWHVRKNGERFFASGAVRPLRDSMGTMLGFIRVTRDITERREAERAVAALATIVETSDDAIISMDLNGIISSWNAGAERLYGYPAREAVGLLVKVLIPPDRVEEETAILERIRRGEAVQHYETVRRRKDGTLVDVSLTVSCLRNTNGQVIGASIIARDISHRKRNETALRQAQAQLADHACQLEDAVANRTAELTAAQAQLRTDLDERKRLEGEVAQTAENEQRRLGRELHDGLAQELTGIRLMLGVLGQKHKSAAPALALKVIKLSDKVGQAAQNARRLAMGLYPVEFEKHGLLPALKGLARQTQESFNVHCAVEADRHAPAQTMGAKAIQLFRIAQEAVHNAVKHAKAKKILIRLTMQDGDWKLTVKDDGIGLPAHAEQAAGMGLRLMQYRARMLGGTLAVRNDEPGGVLVTCIVPGKPSR